MQMRQLASSWKSQVLKPVDGEWARARACQRSSAQAVKIKFHIFRTKRLIACYYHNYNPQDCMQKHTLAYSQSANRPKMCGGPSQDGIEIKLCAKFSSSKQKPFKKGKNGSLISSSKLFHKRVRKRHFLPFKCLLL